MPDRLVLSSEELKQRLDKKQIPFLLDLRSEEDFKAWRIEGRADFTTVNIPQEDFVGEEERHLSRFPKDKLILVVCAHGDSSRYTAELLESHGLTAMSLQGGMDAWSSFYETRKVSDNPTIFQISRAARGCLAHMIVSQGSAIVIDAARHIDRLQKLASSLEVKIVHVFDTHLHADHISGGQKLAAASGAEYHLHPGDADRAALSFVPLADGQKFTFGACTIDVVHSPGHTPGSTSFLVDKKYIFTGDIIMKKSAGRPDLGGQAETWSALLYDTLYRRYANIDDNVIVLPSHSSSLSEQDDYGIVQTTMGRARKELDLYQIKDQAAFTKYIKASLLENPERYQEIRKVNLGMLKPDEAKEKELEIGKNVCGMAKKNETRAA